MALHIQNEDRMKTWQVTDEEWPTFDGKWDLMGNTSIVIQVNGAELEYIRSKIDNLPIPKKTGAFAFYQGEMARFILLTLFV